MFFQRFVFTFLALSIHLTGWAGVTAQGPSIRIPTHAYRMSGKTMFVFMNGARTWNDAASTCKTLYRTQGGSLARIDTMQAMDIISDLIGGYDVWLGVHWILIGVGVSELRWDDAFCTKFSAQDFSAFLDNHGDYDENNMCYYVQQGTWRKQACNSQRRFVCQYQDTAIDELSDCGISPKAFSTAQANVYHVAESVLTDDVCKARCAGTLGCFFTKIQGQRCMLGVVEAGDTAMHFRNTCYDTKTENNIPALSVYDSNSKPGTCNTLDESTFTVTDQVVNGDDPVEAVPATISTTTTTTTITTTPATTTAIAAPFPLVTLTTQIILTTTELCNDTHIGVGMTPLIDTVTETHTITETQMVTTEILLPPPSQTAADIITTTTTTTNICPTTSTTTNNNNNALTTTVTTAAAASPSPLIVVTTATEYIHVTLSPSSCPSVSTSPCAWPDNTVTTTTSTTTGAGGGGGAAGTVSCIVNTIQPTPSTITQTVCPATPAPYAPPTSPGDNTGSLNNTKCLVPKNITLNVAELEEVTDSIVKELTVAKDALSQTRRKKESAPDKRTTAQTSGYLAIVFLSVTFGGVMLTDIPVFYNQIRELVGCKSNA